MYSHIGKYNNIDITGQQSFDSSSLSPPTSLLTTNSICFPILGVVSRPCNAFPTVPRLLLDPPVVLI